MNLKASVLIVCCLSASPALATPVVSVGPSNNAPILKGDAFQVEVSITDVTDLIGFQFDLEFDPNLLQLDDLQPGPLLTQFDPDFFFTELASLDTSTAGLVPNVQGSPFFGTMSDGILALFTFKALNPGTSSLNLANVLLQDLVSFDQGVYIADFDTQNGSVTITAPTDNTPVPEPSTLLLLGTGVAAALRKHRARLSK